jgi:type I restriction-modification system DNA methylase subunit
MIADVKPAIQEKLGDFATAPLRAAATALLATLGYKSERTVRLDPNNAENFIASFAHDRPFNRQQALLDDWQSVDFLFQLTDAEVQDALQLAQSQSLLFESKGAYNGAIIESYLFFAIELRSPAERVGERAGRLYARTELSTVTRAVNRLFDMPVMVLFRHGDTLTLSIIRRRLSKRDESRDVLDKVTLVKDIRFADPLRAHIEILSDLSIAALHEEAYFHNFVGLHAAWEKRLDSYALNERFYREVADWYFWALGHKGVIYPRDVRGDEKRSIFLIRLLTRLIFCWFLQEKRLIPRDLFRQRYVRQMLTDFGDAGGTYYRAFLQNLFFATLNQEPEKREFRHKNPKGRDAHRGVTNLFRYANLLSNADRFESLLRNVPFVNGGLFDCLDEVFAKEEGRRDVRLDDFSDENDNRLSLPNELFFGEEREVDLSAVYDDKRKRREKVRGLIEILGRYKFTVEENTPLEEEIALDPELLGKVFENLLASYNEDTKTTARKATGSFYTRRQIVSYMVDEALLAQLAQSLTAGNGAAGKSQSTAEDQLRTLFRATSDHCENPFTEDQTAALVAAIDQAKIIDPACGSGAFLMGALHRLVDLLKKLDPGNAHWRELQRRRAVAETDETFKLGDKDERERRLKDINEVFDFNASDYGRKLYLIENCIYGVDIQPIGCQIAKLRFFIALIVDQETTRARPKGPTNGNFGIRPLPNLETKIVAANTLVPIEKPRKHQLDLLDATIRPLRSELEKVRHDYFMARTPATKRRCRERDEKLRAQLADLLRRNGMPADSAKALAGWDPYDQNAHAGFFDPGWMFGLRVAQVASSGAASSTTDDGFDVVIGNPPYVRIQTLKQQDPRQVAFFKAHYESAKKGNYDLYVVFVERGLQLLKPAGTLAYILPHKFFNAQYGAPLRGLLAKGRNLKHVVHFGDQQVFPGATNYVCLLFLAKRGADSCRFVRADDLEMWLGTYQGTEGHFPAQAISAAEWTFAVGRGSSVFEQLRRVEATLRDVARIWQGAVTSADRLYILKQVGEPENGLVRVLDRRGEDLLLESDIAKPLIHDISLEPYGIPRASHRIIVPYRLVNEAHTLISPSQFRSQYPHTWKYLKEHEAEFRGRESGKADRDAWYGYIYPKNLALFDSAKLVVQVISQSPKFSFDPDGVFFTGGGNGPYYGVRWLAADERRSIHCLQALLNSHVSDYFMRKISSPFRGGYWSYGKRFIEQLPIPPALALQEASVVQLVDYLLWLNRHFAEHSEYKGPPDALMLGYFEQVLNGLVYELYFPDELRASRLHLFDLVQQAQLPALADIAGAQRLARLRELFETLHDVKHPLYGALFDLRSVEAVRIIEGED